MNEPRIRIKGFRGGWKMESLKNFAYKKTEKNIGFKYNTILTNSAEFGVINQLNFFDHNIVNKDHIEGYYIIDNDDFVYNPRVSVTAPVGPINRNQLGYSGVMSPLYFVFGVDGINKDFLSYFFETNLWHSYMKLNGNSGARFDRLAISDADFFNMPLTIPVNESEQRAIASFFKLLDVQIAAVAKKIEKLKQTKAACLQTMFPQDGKATPRIRYKGFTEEWKKVKLGEIGHCFNGLSGKSKEDFGHGTARYITYMNVFTNAISDVSMLESIEVDAKQNTVQKGDVLFTTSSETPEEVGMSSVWMYDKENVYLNSFCFGYRPDIDADPFFLAYVLRSKDIRRQFQILAQGISRYNISKSKAMEITMFLPSTQEQSLIGKYFYEFEKNIEFETKRLAYLKRIKAACLEEMFV